MIQRITESDIELAALGWLESVGCGVGQGADIAPDAPDGERGNYGRVIFEGRLSDVLARLKPKLPADALGDALRKLKRPEGAELMLQNRSLRRLLVDG